MKIRYAFIKEKVQEIFIDSNIEKYPIDIKGLIKSFPYCKVVSYKKHMKKYSLSANETIGFFGTEEGCTDYNPLKNRYIIFYNNLNEYYKSSERIRWTLAHELGHILLNHHKLTNKTKIFRSSLNDNEYSIFESEANRFAALLLAYPLILHKLDIRNKDDIKYICALSDEASDYRYNDYLKWIKRPILNTKDRKILKNFYGFINHKYCSVCNSKIDNKDIDYCPICGFSEILRGEGKMKYDYVELNEKNKTKFCPTCENENTNIAGDYCQICGSHIKNLCTNPNCEAELPGEARYCMYCAAPSSFYNNNYLCDWQQFQTDLAFLGDPSVEDTPISDFDSIDPKPVEADEYSDIPF